VLSDITGREAVFYRSILHIHIPSFSVEVMRLSDPSLRDRPVVIALPSSRSVILCASPEAKDLGIKKGMQLKDAREICPDLLIIPPDTNKIRKVFREINSRVISRFSPIWEPSRPGHVYLDLSGTERLWGKARDVAFKMEREIKKVVELPSIVGISINKMVSSIASIVQRDECVLEVERGYEASFLAPFSVDVIPGIQRFHRTLLEELNIYRVRELAHLGIDELRLIFGSSARVIKQRAVGIDPSPVIPPDGGKIIRETLVFNEDTNDKELLMGALLSLTESCTNKLREKGLCSRRAGLYVEFSDGISLRRYLNFPSPLQSDFEIFPPLKNLFLKVIRRRVRVRSITLCFSGLSSGSYQIGLFDNAFQREKRERLERSLDLIRKRFGESAIKYASSYHLKDQFYIQ